MGKPLEGYIHYMIAFLLYTQGNCNYDLCKKHLENDFDKWKYFDNCLGEGITILSKYESFDCNLYCGLSKIYLKKEDITEIGYLSSYLSTSKDRNVAITFQNGKGCLLEINRNIFYEEI